MSKINKDLQNLIVDIGIKKDSLFSSLRLLNYRVNKICDFDACITIHSVDGFLLLNLDSRNEAPISCLYGKTENNKLTELEHEELSI